MNQHQLRRAIAAPSLAAATPSDARKLAESLMDVMSDLLGIIDHETELVRAGKLREAMTFESNVRPGRAG